MRQPEVIEAARREVLDVIARLNRADEGMRIIIRRSLERTDDLAEAVAVRIAIAAAIRHLGGEPED